MFLARNVIM